MSRPSRHVRLLALAVPALVAAAAGAQPPAARRAAPAAARADLVVVNARVYTADSLRPTAEAIAVAGGRVLYAGTRDSALRLRAPRTRVVDAGGRTVLPGLVDAHAHLSGLGIEMRRVDLTGTRSYDEVIARVVERARTTPKGQWVLGRGWDQNDWGEGTPFPTHEALSRAVPDHPVFLTRVDGHAALTNARAMQAAGVTRATRDPEGGRVERAADGLPTGVFVDNAQELVERRVPATTPAQMRRAILDAVSEANRWGLTGVHDAGVDRATVQIYEQLAREGRLNLREYVMLAGSDTATVNHYLRRGPQSALHGGRVWIRAIKLYADGALGSRGAALLEPYSDDPDNRGLILTPFERLLDVERRALERGFQVNVHAIGDRANRTALDLADSALKLVPAARRRDHRFRVEHAQVLHPDDVPRFAALGVIPSMQASHQTSDMYWAERRLGAERTRGAYAWKSLLGTGVIVPNGSDFPVEQVNPLISFHSAVSRQDAKDFPAGGWYPEQRMTREQALLGMTLWPAIAGFQERDLGSLTPGKYADFVILDQDIMTVPAEEILKTNVVATYLGGRAVYERK